MSNNDPIQVATEQKCVDYPAKLFLWSTKNWKWLLLIMVVFSFSVRLTAWLIAPRMDKDGLLYITIAQEMKEHGLHGAFSINPRIPPLYPAGICGLTHLGLDYETAGRLLSLLSGAFLPLFVFLAAIHLFKKKSLALLAGLFAAIHPYFIDIGSQVMRDGVFISLLALALALSCIAAKRQNLLFWIFAAIAIGVATLVRSEGIELLVVALAFLVLEGIVRREIGLKALAYRFTALACLILFFSLSTFPVQYYMRNSTSTWTVIDHRILTYVSSFSDRTGLLGETK